MVLRDYLPPALRGLMVAAFLAAFMSTVGTQLNWGCSYLVNDLYKRFLVRNSTEGHYVLVGRLFTVVLVLASGYTAAQLWTPEGAPAERFYVARGWRRDGRSAWDGWLGLQMVGYATRL